MMQIRVLGELAVEVDGRELDRIASGRARALLGWLALHPGLHPRSRVAAQFWPDVLDESARASLRTTLATLRRELGEDGAGCIDADRERVGIADGPGVWVDVREFERLVAARRGAEALELCRGELLSDLDDDWVLAQRDAHRDRVLAVLAELGGAAEETGDLRAAVGYSRDALAVDPLSEDTARTLMRRLAGASSASDPKEAVMSHLVFDEDTARQLEALYRTGDAKRRRRLVQEALAAAPGERILDAGCGPGYSCAELAEAVGRHGCVVGVDSSAPMLALATQRCARVPSVVLRSGDVGALPAEDAAFDAALMGAGGPITDTDGREWIERLEELDARGAFSFAVTQFCFTATATGERPPGRPQHRRSGPDESATIPVARAARDQDRRRDRCPVPQTAAHADRVGRRRGRGRRADPRPRDRRARRGPARAGRLTVQRVAISPSAPHAK